MWVFAGESYTLLIEYQVDGEFVIPTSANVTLRDQTGTALALGEVLDVTSTQASYQVSGVWNNLTVGNTVENRFVTVQFIYAGQSYRKDLVYRVSEFIPMTTSPDEVRGFLGLEMSELPDKDIDLLQAYFQLAKEYGQDFTDALASGTLLAIQANYALAIKAALNLIPSLQLRVGVKLSSEESRFERMSKFDIREIEMQLANQLAMLMEDILDETIETVSVLQLATPTDPVTGV